MADVQKKFIFKKEPGIVAWPCTISVPIEGGAREEQQITPRFKVLSQEKLEQAFPAFGMLAQGSSSPRQFLEEAIDGFDDLKDADGKKIDDMAAKETLLSLPYGIDGLTRGYFDMIGRRLAKN